MGTFDMIEHLQKVFEGHARQDQYDTSKKLFHYIQGEHEPVVPYVQMMIGYIEYLDKLGCPLPAKLQTDLVLQSLNKNFTHFVNDYIMQDYKKPLTELLGLL